MQQPKSQIFHSGYEKWEGDRKTHTPAWILIGLAGLKNVVKSSGCLGRALFIIFLVSHYVMISAITFVRLQIDNLKNLEQLRFLEPLGQQFVGWTEASVHRTQILAPAIGFSIFAMIFYGAQLIAKDKNVNALQVYFSKAVSPLDYLIGKYFSISMIVALMTLVPGALMLILGLVFTTDYPKYLAQSWFIPIVTGLFWLLLTFAIGTMTLFFSSCFRKTYMASVSFLGLLVFSWIVSKLLRLIIGFQDFVGGLNWIGSIHDIGDALYTFETTSVPSLVWQIIDLALLCSLMLFVMFRNIRPVEVVK